jgi:hypothetical protein
MRTKNSIKVAHQRCFCTNNALLFCSVLQGSKSVRQSRRSLLCRAAQQPRPVRRLQGSKSVRQSRRSLLCRATYII